jgi:hypothetical protein
MNHPHHMTVCEEHECVLSQCRCPSPDKVKRRVSCPGTICPGRLQPEKELATKTLDSVTDPATEIHRCVIHYPDGRVEVHWTTDQAVFDAWADNLVDWDARGQRVELYSGTIEWGRDLGPQITRLLHRLQKGV